MHHTRWEVGAGQTSDRARRSAKRPRDRPTTARSRVLVVSGSRITDFAIMGLLVVVVVLDVKDSSSKE